MVQSGMGSGGPNGAILTIQESIVALHPSAVVMVGIAFGMNESKQQIGDILVSERIMDYNLQRIGTDDDKLVIVPRGDRSSASTRMLNRFKAAVYPWGEVQPKVKFGLILSGDKLVDNQDFRDQLLKLQTEAIGGEMEGGGLYAAAQRNKVDWILVKAICDWGDGHKKVNKSKRQEKAAENAVRFTKFVLEQGGFGNPMDQGSQPIAAHDQSHASTSSPSTTLTLTLKTELVDLLLACSIRNSGTRETALRLLNQDFPGIIDRIDRRSVSIDDVTEVVGTCEQWEGSLQAFCNIVIRLEGNGSINARNLRSFMHLHGL